MFLGHIFYAFFMAGIVLELTFGRKKSCDPVISVSQDYV